MSSTHKLILSEEDRVPQGFVLWLRTMQKVNTKVFGVMDEHLSQNDLPEAIKVFEKTTRYNVNKIWH